MEGKSYYGLNYSQDLVHKQVSIVLFKRVQNILFSLKFEKPLNRELMHKAINLLIERNDCLRMVFTKRKFKLMQYFQEKNSINHIPYLVFDTVAERTSFIHKFRSGSTNPFKGRMLEVVFAKDLDGKDQVYIKISHYVADLYGVSLLVNDLLNIYASLADGTEMPAPKGSFEEVLAKDVSNKENKDLLERDRKFFEDYLEKHSQPPMYCGLHGSGSDYWMKKKKKGLFYVPFRFVTCSTEGYMMNVPSAVTENVMKWCNENELPLSTFFFYAFAVATSWVNGKEKYQSPLMLVDNRATMNERNCGGCKVQSIGLYTEVDWEKSFKENIQRTFEEQNQLFRHTKTSYFEMEMMQHKKWGYPMLSQVINFCYSYIQTAMPDGVSMQVLTNGKGSLPAYVALQHNVRTNEISVIYDIQTAMTTASQLIDFHNNYIRVIERVIACSNESLNEVIQ